MDLTAKELMPIPINEFTKGELIPVDLYMRLSEEKFILVGKAGAHSSVEQFQKYQDREVSYLWVVKKEYYKMAHQSVSLAGIAINRKDLDDKQKATLVTHAARSMFRQIEHLGMDLETYNNSKQIMQAVIGLAESHKSLSDLFSSFAGYSDRLMAHSVAVSTLNVVIGLEMGFEKKSNLEKLALGGLLHDIGLKAIPNDLLEKPLAAMTSDEIQMYETHAFKGMQMLQTLGIVPDDVVSIVYEHHENSIGQGYPQRLRDVKMHPLAKVTALSNAYADLIFPNVNNPIPKNPREALMYIEHTLGTPYNRELFRALKRVIDGQKKNKAA